VRGAIEACGISFHAFALTQRDDEPPEVTFSPRFLDLFGLSVPPR
jgi:hypothetical protein